MNAFCDVLVVGSGPAGLMAAKAAAESGKRVILADLEPRFGGSANWSGETIDGMPAADWAEADGRASCRGRANVRLLPRTTVWGYYDDNTLAALERVTDHKRDRRARASRATATGRSAPAPWCWRPAPSSGRWYFPGNDRPA